MEAVGNSFGRHIDVTLRVEGSGGHPEHLLFLDPFEMVLRNFVVKLAHGDVEYCREAPKTLRDTIYRPISGSTHKSPRGGCTITMLTLW